MTEFSGMGGGNLVRIRVVIDDETTGVSSYRSVIIPAKNFKNGMGGCKEAIDFIRVSALDFVNKFAAKIGDNS